MLGLHHPVLSNPVMRVFPGTGQEAETVCLHVIQGPRSEGSRGHQAASVRGQAEEETLVAGELWGWEAPGCP